MNVPKGSSPEIFGAEPVNGCGRWASMDRFYLTLICGGIILLVIALALSAPTASRDDRANTVIVLHSGQR